MVRPSKLIIYENPKILVCSLLLRCMFEVWLVACGGEGITQYTISAGNLILILALFTADIQVSTFWYILRL